MIKKSLVVFILGGPGSGKGTQSALIQDKFKFVHLSAGDLLREERKTPGSEFGQIIQTRINNGQIVPSSITVQLLKKAMTKSGSQKFLIDGFPRNAQNLQTWQKMLGSQVDTPFVVFLDCGQETLQKRLMKRSQTSGRSDDNIQVIRKRFKTYQNQTVDIIKHYQKLGKLLTVNSQGSVEQIFKQLEPSFNKYC